MYKKILFISFMAVFSVNAWCGSADIQTNNTYKAIDIKKVELKMAISKAIDDCKCLLNKVSNYQQLFPLNDKNQKPYTAATANYGFKEITTQYIYNQTINDLTKNIAITSDKATKIVDEWPREKNSPQDIKNLEINVSEELRAFSSFCIAPVEQVSEGIHKNSSFFNRKKIDAKKLCNVK